MIICPTCDREGNDCLCMTPLAAPRHERRVPRVHSERPPRPERFSIEDDSDLHIRLAEYLDDDRFGGLFAESIGNLRRKNRDYSGDQDRIANFRRLAEELGLPMRQIWLVFFSKSMDAIRRYCRDGLTESEPIRQRLVDAIDYLALLDKIVAEQEAQST